MGGSGVGVCEGALSVWLWCVEAELDPSLKVRKKMAAGGGGRHAPRGAGWGLLGRGTILDADLPLRICGTAAAGVRGEKGGACAGVLGNSIS